MRYAWVVTGTPPHCTPFEEIQVWDMQHHPSIENVHPMRLLHFLAAQIPPQYRNAWYQAPGILEFRFSLQNG